MYGRAYTPPHRYVCGEREGSLETLRLYVENLRGRTDFKILLKRMKEDFASRRGRYRDFISSSSLPFVVTNSCADVKV